MSITKSPCLTGIKTLPKINPPPMYLLYLLYLLLLTPIASYREVGSSSENDPFVPYESGFVGKENLASNFGRERVNEGSSRTQTLPRLFGGLDMGDNRANQVCPGMVGPMKDGKVSLGETKRERGGGKGDQRRKRMIKCMSILT